MEEEKENEIAATPAFRGLKIGVFWDWEREEEGRMQLRLRRRFVYWKLILFGME